MANVKLNGDTSGSTQISAPNTGGDNVFTFPGTTGSSGQVLSTDGTGILSWISAVSVDASFSTTISTIWSKPSTGTIAIVLIWSGGGSGGRNVGSLRGGGGGGGGGCGFGIFKLSDLPSSVSITIGAGGAARTTEANGFPGNSSSFGSLITVSGGLGGQQYDGGTLGYGGAGGGFGGTGSSYNAGDGSTSSGVKGGFGLFGGAGGGMRISIGGDGMFGAAGGGGRYNGTSYAGGVSFVGGDGGSGGDTGVDGSIPGGGGGGAQNGTNSGAGARGECRIYVI